MSLYVLDTDILTLYRQSHPRVSQNVVLHLSDDLATTVISVEEVLTGWYTLLRRVIRPPDVARAYQELADSIPWLATLLILPHPVSTIARYDQLAAMKLNVGKMDLRIAAIALENGGVVVDQGERIKTHNLLSSKGLCHERHCGSISANPLPVRTWAF